MPMSKLHRLLHPHHKGHDQDHASSPSSSQSTLASPSDLSAADDKLLKDKYGGTCSSGEMFAMFKAMAGSRLPGVKRRKTEDRLDVNEDSDAGDLTDETETPQAMTPPSEADGGNVGTADDDSPGVDPAQALDKQMLASRLAALSLSNLSPLTHPATDHHSRKRPALPRYNSTAAKDDPIEHKDDMTAVSPLQTMSEIPTTPSSPPMSPTSVEASDSEAGAEDATDEEKLKAIIEDFGEIAELQVPTEDNDSPWEAERFLAESTGSLFRGVMLIGNLHLTTHRLLFHALLPPLAATIANGEPGDGLDPRERAMDSAMAQFTVLHSGAVNVHKPGILQAKRRLWMELSSEMITSYPSADEAGRVRPIRALMLSSIRSIAPLDPAHPHDLVLTYDTVEGQPPRTTRYSVDTPESALQWRREIEGALFRHARARWARRRKAAANPEDPNAPRGDLSESAPGEPDTTEDWSMLRVCIPLDRIHLLACEDYHGFARLLNIDVDLERDQSVDNLPYNASKAAAIIGGDPHVVPLKPGDDLPPINRAETAPSLGLPIDDRPSPTTERSSMSLRKSITSLGSPRRGQSPVRREQSQARRDPSALPMPLTYIPTRVPTTGPDGGPSFCGGAAGPNEDDLANSCNMRIGLLNQHEWFAKAFNAALHASHGRRYKDPEHKPEVIIKVGDHDCLKADDERDEHSRESSLDSDHSQHDPEDTHPGYSAAKAEKAAMAAKVFGIDPADEVWIKRCYISSGLVPVRGHIIISSRFICFWRRNKAAADVKYRFPLHEVKGAVESKSLRLGMHGMNLQIEGQHDLRFEFWNVHSREETMARIAQAVQPGKTVTPTSDVLSSPGAGVESPGALSRSASAFSRTSTDIRQNSILAPRPDLLQQQLSVPDHAINYVPFIANRLGDGKIIKPRHFMCLTIGSRGDVQPYIALALGLMKDNHRVTIVTHPEFKEWIEGYGIGHKPAGGDPTALMKLSADHKMFSVGFFQESIGYFRQWLDDLLVDSWHACEDADVLIESPSTMSGVHIAEALKIPYFRAFTMPWTRTSAYPQAFMVPAVEMGPGFNYSTYVLYDNIIWTATAPQINRWRKKHLMLKATDMAHLSVKKIPFLYNFSSAVVPKPLDWHDDITITGYWNLENSDTEWTPPAELEAFIKKARELSKPLVYIGFGSIVVNHADQMTRSIIKAVTKADVYAVIAKGWSSRGAEPAKEGQEIVYPENCYPIEKVPHGWLFPQIDAAMHHGGAGTVGASLRAGLPTMIKPFFGDQFFWANRVTRLEAGVRVNSLGSDDLASALTKATTSTVMIEKARRIGEKIRAEDGVGNAKRAIYSQLSRAASDRTKMHWAKV